MRPTLDPQLAGYKNVNGAKRRVILAGTELVRVSLHQRPSSGSKIDGCIW
jgi:hypothetical protein